MYYVIYRDYLLLSAVLGTKFSGYFSTTVGITIVSGVRPGIITPAKSFSTINSHTLCLFQVNISVNVDFMAKKPQKVQKIGPIAVPKKNSHPTFFNIFA